MRRHARVDVLSIVTFNYWFRERDANSQILFIDVHKCCIYNDKIAISMPKFIGRTGCNSTTFALWIESFYFILLNSICLLIFTSTITTDSVVIVIYICGKH